MKILSFVNNKGGVFKTTTAYNITGILAYNGKKVLLIDCDAQGNATNAFGINNKIKDFIGVDLLFDKKDTNPSEIILKSPHPNMPTVDVIPANQFLDATEMTLVNRTRREFILKRYIKKYEDIFNKYDYIITDTSPRFSIININVYLASDEIILVSDIDVNSYLGCLALLETWGDIAEDLEIPNNIHGLIIGRYDKRIRLSSEFVEIVKSNDKLNKLMFKSIIPDNVKVKESNAVGVPLIYYNKNNTALTAYLELYKEMVERGVL